MNGEFVLFLGRRAMETALLLAGPPMIVALSVGLASAMLQAITSIRDMTLGMVLKVVGVGVCVLLMGGWMLQVIVGFTTEVFQHINGLTQ